MKWIFHSPQTYFNMIRLQRWNKPQKLHEHRYNLIFFYSSFPFKFFFKNRKIHRGKREQLFLQLRRIFHKYQELRIKCLFFAIESSMNLIAVILKLLIHDDTPTIGTIFLFCFFGTRENISSFSGDKLRQSQAWTTCEEGKKSEKSFSIHQWTTISFSFGISSMKIKKRSSS